MLSQSVQAHFADEEMDGTQTSWPIVTQQINGTARIHT